MRFGFCVAELLGTSSFLTPPGPPLTHGTKILSDYKYTQLHQGNKICQ